MSSNRGGGNPKGKHASEVNRPKVEQLSQDIGEINLGSTEDDGNWEEVIGRKSKNRAGSAAAKPWGSPSFTSKSWGQQDAQKPSMRSIGGSGRAAGNSWASQAVDSRKPAGRGNGWQQSTARSYDNRSLAPQHAIPPPLDHGWNWQSRAGITQPKGPEDNKDILSFRGEDTRYGFTGHLYNSLVRKGIKTFRDNDLTRGEEISEALLRAIGESKLSLIVFSENYASSKWCLEELVYILECKISKNQMVHPIFYKVDPSDVRHQSGTFGKALAPLECRFQDDRGKVSGWRAALFEASNLAGSTFCGGYDEFVFIDRIVEEISKIFPPEPTYLDMPKCQVGLDSRVEHMLEMLDVGGSDVRMVGIWGTSGIGKTTIAKAVYNAIAQKFDGCCFLENVRERSEQHGGLANLQRIILSDIVRLKELEINNVDQGITLSRDKLRDKRILLVLDDVNDLNQLDKLAGASDWFGHGSRIIITTRDKRLLTVHDINLRYQARELDPDEGCKLFSSYAFKTKSNSLDDNEKLLVSTVVEYTQGLPLVLQVLGSHLHKRPLDKWQAMIEGFKRNHPKGVTDILKVSYDGLEKTEREVFLDIACFFNGRVTNDVIQILEGCGHINPEHSIEILEEKALINAPKYGRISMHNLLEEMGKQIVDQESNKPGERSRLWYHADVRQVLTEDTGTNKIEGIIVKMPTTDEIWLSPECFKNMKNLKIFINVNGRFVGKVKHYPNQLRLLDWPECPLEYLPSGFDMKKMVQLNLPRSRIIRLEGSMKNLTSLDLSKCIFLTQIPDMSGSPKLESLDLSWCKSLEEVHPSVGSLQNLKTLLLYCCESLTQIPDMSGSPKLESLDLSCCKSLEEVHPSVGSLQNLKTLLLYFCESLTQIPDMSGSPNLELLALSFCSSLEEVHPSVGYLEKLVDLNLEYCRNLVKLPPKVNWRSLQKLQLDRCSKLESFPKIVGEMKCMTSLELRYTGIKTLLLSIRCLITLERLILSDCGNLTKVVTLSKVDSPDNGDYLPGCNSSKIDFLWPTLVDLDLFRCPVVTLPECIMEFVNLSRLSLRRCMSLVEIPELPPLIKELDASDCVSLERISKLTNILECKKLNLRGCTRLVEIPELPPFIRELNASYCVSLERISKLSNFLEGKESQMIKEMKLINCWRLGQNLLAEMAASKEDDDLFSRLLCSQLSECSIIFPVATSKIPKWFSCQMDFMGHRRFEFWIEALPNFKWENTGLALCVALDGQSPCSFEFEIHINEVSVSHILTNVSSRESDHVWVRYFPFAELGRRCYMRPLPPFTGRVDIILRESHCFQSCGVHLIMPPNEDACMKLIRAENLTSGIDLDLQRLEMMRTRDTFERNAMRLDKKYRPKHKTDCKEFFYADVNYNYFQELYNYNGKVGYINESFATFISHGFGK